MDEAAKPPLSRTGWKELLERSTLRIDVLESEAKPATSQGTGFFVAPGIVATCAHVISDNPDALPSRVTGTDSSGHVYGLRATQRGYFKSPDGLDVALLTLEPPQEPIIKEYVLSNPHISLGDKVWSYGHPTRQFRQGDSAAFRYVGESVSALGGTVRLRLQGTPVSKGFSGSPAVNVRTGAVVGMLSIANSGGSAHLIPISEVLSRLEVPNLEPPISWLEALDDEELRRGGWGFPSQDIRRYVDLVQSTKDAHPYACLIPGVDPPPLSKVYLTQRALWHRADSHPTRLSPQDLLQLEGLLFISAPPGGGKSSLLRRLLAEVCDRFAGQDYSLVPVRVRAADLARERPLPALLAASVQKELINSGASWTVPPRVFKRRPLPDGRWIVLVDGLDEIVDQATRRLVLDRLRKLADLGVNEYRFVVTSRPLGAELEADFDSRVGQFSLMPFDRDQLIDCVRLWFQAVNLSSSPPPEQFVERLDARGLAGLARNPLMLSMLCQLVGTGEAEQIPESRFQLYERFTEAVAFRQYELGTSGIRAQLSLATERFGADAELAADRLLTACEPAIRRLAFERLRGEVRPSVDLIMEWLSGIFPSRLPQGLWRTLASAVVRRNGLLLDDGRDLVFIHGTITDFLAARHVETDSAVEEREYARVFSAAEAIDIDSETSYLRFIFARWKQRRGFAEDLISLIDSDPLAAGRLVAACAIDGNPLPLTATNHAVRQLKALALASGADERVQSSAVVGILQLNSSVAYLVLERIIRDARTTSMRAWALEAITSCLEGRPTVTVAPWEPSDEEVWIGPALWRLAQLPDGRGVDFLSRLAHGGLSSDTESAAAMRVLDVLRTNRSDRLLSSLAQVGTVDSEVDSVIGPLLETILAVHPRADITVVERAYIVAKQAHLGQRRMSGDDYITHPLAVTTILAELGMTPPTLAAALLHDTIEDTAYSPEALRRDFGDEIAMLVDGVTKLDRGNYGQAESAETVRKMVVAMARDIRVLVIKLADRLHNARTWRYTSPESAQRKAKETLEIYAPLAQRLGMTTMQRELEDLAFQALYPKVYDEVARVVAERVPAGQEYLASARRQVETVLKNGGVSASVSGRLKHYYSVYQKVIVHQQELEELYDLVGVRVLVDTVRDCYAALGLLHARWNPVRGCFEDYIASPTSSRYQSLHTVIVGPEGTPIEIQIRTHEMHRRAEFGGAARLKFGEDSAATDTAKALGTRDEKAGPANDMGWLRQLLDWQRESSDTSEFLDSLRFETTASEVYVFTPKGTLVGLPAGATPVDFAYAVHTEVGHHCIGARVNGSRVPLDSRLDNGDVVEVITSKSDSTGPSRDWLNSVRSRRARKSIRRWLSDAARQDDPEPGKTIVT